MTNVVDSLRCIEFRVRTGINQVLFPDDTLILRRKFELFAQSTAEGEATIEDIRMTIFADDMKKVELRKDLQSALKAWT